MDSIQVKHEINEVVTRYCRGVDRNDWELVRSCYYPDASDDHAGYVGARDAFVEWARQTTARNIMMNHCVMNHYVMIEDATHASSETYTLCFHRLRDADDALVDNTVMVRYLDRFERRDDRWLIADRTVIIDWSRTDPVTDREFPAGTVTGTRDPEDRSFSLFPMGPLPPTTLP